MMRTRSKVRAVAVAAGATVVIGLSAGTASAHVGISEPEHVAGQYTLLTFGVPHGCDGSATTEVRIQIPEEIPQVTPTVNRGWDVTKVMVELDEPIEGGHGVTLTERVGEVVYTAHEPLPADLRDAFVLSLQAPDLPGETLYFPVVQICEEVSTPGSRSRPTMSPQRFAEPAPSILIVAALTASPRAAEWPTWLTCPVSRRAV